MIDDDSIGRAFTGKLHEIVAQIARPKTSLNDRDSRSCAVSVAVKQAAIVLHTYPHQLR